MSKYNIRKIDPKLAEYHAGMSEKQKDILYRDILRVLVDEGKFIEHDFSAGKLAKELDVPPQAVSVVFATRFHKSFPLYVNDCRIEYAVALLSDRNNKKVNLGYIGEMCGYATRQSFYSNFYRRMGCTPKEYRNRCFPNPCSGVNLHDSIKKVK